MSRYDTGPRKVMAHGLEWTEQFNCYRTAIGYAQLSIVWVGSDGYRVEFMHVGLKKRFSHFDDAVRAGLRFARKALEDAITALPKDGGAP